MPKKAKKNILWDGITDLEKETFAYYRELGYDSKTAEVLTRFTYGDICFMKTDINQIYDMLHQGMTPREIADLVNQKGDPCDYEKLSSNYEPPRRLPLSVMKKMRQSGMKILQIKKAEYIFQKTGFIPEEFLPEYEEKQARKAKSVSATRATPEVLPEALPDSVSESHLTANQVEGAAMFAQMMAGNMPDAVEQVRTGDSEVIEEKGHRNTMIHPTSTFRMTTNTASTGMIRVLLRNGMQINRSMVRIEELLNDFRYEFDKPKKEMFSLSWSIMPSPNNPNIQYLMLGAQGKKEPRKRQNIVLLLDVSGSMSSNRICTQALIATVVSKLEKGDICSLVIYSTYDMVILDGFEIKDKCDRLKILNHVFSLSVDGLTRGSVGIERAYEIGKKHFIDGGNNQVILITDGDLNFGITYKGELQKLIEEKKKSNLFLSVVGVGLNNYRDDKLEVIAKNGNGVYRAVNNIEDVRRSVFEDFDSLTCVIAKDVKGQIEFNPELVNSYRLLGFENREIAHEDFRNDKVISEPFGSGGYGVVLYELNMRKGGRRVNSELKYQTIFTNASNELATFQVRYKKPLEEESYVQEIVIPNEINFNDNLKLAYTIYVYSEMLRGSNHIGADEIKTAKRFRKKLGKKIVQKNGKRLELLEVIENNY